MSMLNVEVLEKIIENVPDDFDVGFVDNEGIVHYLSDVVEVNVSKKELLFKSK